MNKFGGSAHFRLPSVVGTFVGLFATASVLCFIRAHHLNAFNAGWGDPQQDRYQWLLGWGVHVSAIVALSCFITIAAGSRRALISIVTGVAFSGLSAIIVPWFPVIGIILAFPGWLATLLTFGVHDDGGYEVGAYTLIINAFVYGAVAFLILWIKSARDTRPSRLHSDQA